MTHFHGSKCLIDKVLIPSPSNVLDGESAVFATLCRCLAIAFIPRWSDDDIELCIDGDVITMTEMYPCAFELLKTPGYVYTVDGDFHDDDRLMVGSEFISSNRVSIVATEQINDVYAELSVEKNNVILQLFS